MLTFDQSSGSSSSDFALLLVNLVRLTLHIVPLTPGCYELASSFGLDLQWELRQRAQDDARLVVVHDVDDAIFLTLDLQLKALQRGTETYFRHTATAAQPVPAEGWCCGTATCKHLTPERLGRAEALLSSQRKRVSLGCRGTSDAFRG
jgi:hypothetical protein